MASTRSPPQNVAVDLGQGVLAAVDEVRTGASQSTTQAHATVDAQLGELSQLADQAHGHAGRVVSQTNHALNSAVGAFQKLPG